jgi:hypothetical protein
MRQSWEELRNQFYSSTSSLLFKLKAAQKKLPRYNCNTQQSLSRDVQVCAHGGPQYKYVPTGLRPARADHTTKRWYVVRVAQRKNMEKNKKKPNEEKLLLLKLPHQLLTVRDLFTL